MYNYFYFVFVKLKFQDSKLINEMADGDGDGKIGLEDFRAMVPLGKATLTVGKGSGAGKASK